MTWIKLEDRPPDDSGAYLVYAESQDKNKPFIRIAWHELGEPWHGIPLAWNDAISHWMPLPEPPITNGENE